MSYPRSTSIAAVLACAIGACVVEVEQTAEADDEAVLDHVEALGYARENVEVDGDIVLVGGDLIFDRTLLLEGAYERPVSAERDVIQKGYRYPDIISVANQANVKLAFATGPQAPSKVVRDGFIAAAKAWSSIPGSALRVSTSNTGPAIRVHMIQAANWKKPNTPCPKTDACALAPLNGRPGSKLYIRSGSKFGDCVGWSGSNLASATRHELGHALGFAHPAEADADPVPGTEACRFTTEETCAKNLNYSTIMGPAEVLLGCSVSPARLTKDDYATVKAVYPEAP